MPNSGSLGAGGVRRSLVMPVRRQLDRPTSVGKSHVPVASARESLAAIVMITSAIKRPPDRDKQALGPLQAQSSPDLQAAATGLPI